MGSGNCDNEAAEGPWAEPAAKDTAQLQPRWALIGNSDVEAH